MPPSARAELGCRQIESALLERLLDGLDKAGLDIPAAW
jgi:hypothetical protein